MDFTIWLEGGHWGLVTAVYLFFATLGGGGYVAGVLARAIAGDDADFDALALARWSFLVALVATAVSGLAILSHLADPLAGLLFPLTLTEFGSWITRGTWILVSLGVFAALQTLWFHFGAAGTDRDGSGSPVRRLAAAVRARSGLDRLADATRPRGALYGVVAAVSLLPALGTVYTGYELAVVETVPLWNNPTLLPALFLASGVASGTAAALALTLTFEGVSDRLVVGFAAAVELALVLTVVLLWRLWASLDASPAAVESVTMLTVGELAVPFMLMVGGIVVSLVATPVLAWVGYGRRGTPKPNRVVKPGLVTSLALSVLSAFLIRYLLLLAAVKDPILVVA